MTCHYLYNHQDALRIVLTGNQKQSFSTAAGLCGADPTEQQKSVSTNFCELDKNKGNPDKIYINGETCKIWLAKKGK